jgi:uncharacterized OsmC-like protein
MATVKPKMVGKFTIAGDCISHARTDVEVRDVDVTIDEPTQRGGTNMGLTPVETLMAALLGCTNVIGHKCAEKHGIELDYMSVTADVTFDRSGTQLQEEIAVPFPKIVLKIDVTTSADDAAIENVKSDLGKFCPLAKVLREAGTKIEEIWTITRP